MRRITAFASAVAVAVVGLTAIPTAAAEEVTDTASISLTCKATPSTRLAGPQVFSADDVSVNVTSPTDVEIGEEFGTTFSIDPVSVEVPSLPMGARLESASRLKLDFALPDGVTFLGSEIDESAANLRGFHVLQINESGNPDPNGRILRLTSADNATIGNGPNSSKSSHGGIRHDITGSTIDLRFPVIKLNLRADTEGEKHFGVRTAGAAGTFGADENFMTMIAQTSSVAFVGRIWAPTQCSPRASETAPIDPRANQLATVRVNPAPAAAETSLTIDEAIGATAGAPVRLTAAITPADAAGTVVFTSGERTSGPVEVVDGRATGELTFPEAGDYEVTASFTPANADAHTASSASRTVTVAGRETELSVTAAASAPARNRVDVTATVDPEARGTVSFRIGAGAEVSAEVTDGTATASVPTGTATGEQTVTAVFRPATGSPFAPAEASTTIEITAITETSLELQGLDSPVKPGETATITAVVIPAENTEVAEGEVVFSVDGAELRSPVSGNRAAIEFIPDRGGDFPVTARYVPADETQTPAEANGTLKVTAAGDTTVTAEAPTGVQPLVEAPTPVTVSPAADGTVTARVDGRDITADVVDGEATLPLVFPREGEFEVPITFAPADPAVAKRAETTINVTVASAAYDSVTIDIAGPTTGRTGEKLDYTATVTPNEGDRSAVTGFITLTNNGHKIQRDGGDVRIPVVRGIAEFDLTWPKAGEQVIVATFHNSEGTLGETGTKTVTITGDAVTPTDPTDPTDPDDPDAGGELPDDPDNPQNPTPPNGSSGISSFFDRLWQWIVDLFTGNLSSSSSSIR